MYMKKLSTTPFFIHFVTQEEGHTFCTLRDFRDKESWGKNGHNLHKIMGEFGESLNIFKKKIHIKLLLRPFQSNMTPWPND